MAKGEVNGLFIKDLGGHKRKNAQGVRSTPLELRLKKKKKLGWFHGDF